LSGTWGDTVNNYITNYIDASVAGAQTVTADTTLTKTTGTSLGSTSSQYAIIIASPASANITITVPATSKIYTIINTSATYTVKIVGAGPTTGVTLGVSEKAQVAWNGSDFVRVGASGGAASFSSITNTGLTSGRVVYSTTGGLETDSANLTFNGTTLTAAGFAGPFNGTVGATTANTGAFTTLSASSTVSGTGFSTYLASPPAIGGTAAAAGSFTTLAASSTVSGTGFTTYFASPPAIGGTAAAAGSFTTLAASSTVSGTGFTNLFAAPPAIGGTTAAAGAFTTLSATSTISGAGITSLFASPPAIGGTAAAAGSFTTLAASSTVSGTGFSNYLASPPAIGGTSAAAGSFTTLSASSSITQGGVAVPTISSTSTFTNKWIQPRVLASTANSATPTLNTDSYDMMVITGQSLAISSFTTNLTGTPVNGQKLWISITGTTAIGITWGGSFESSTVTLPTTTVTTNRFDVGFVWNVATSKWRCVASA
jgi:hypothetical protein